MGQLNMLEIAKDLEVKKFIYASSSSVYGGNKDLPFSTKQRVDHPVSLYAATKKSTELLAECYSKLFNMNAIGLRFFTVYGPWGRPDMATFIFTKKILKNEAINIFNYGKMKRDFTYIDDIVKGIFGAIQFKSSNKSSHKVYNLGNNNSEELMTFIEVIEKNLEIKSKKNFLPMQPGDVNETFADIFKSSNTKIIQIAVCSDIFFTPDQNRWTHHQLLELGLDSQYVELDSDDGHDAFLIESEQISQFLNKIFKNHEKHTTEFRRQVSY